MDKQELIRRLTALISALGLLAGAPALAQDAQGDQGRPTQQGAEARKGPPPLSPLYGIRFPPLYKAGDLAGVEQVIKNAEEALRWSETPEGRQELAARPELQRILEDIRSNLPDAKKRLAEARAKQRQSAPAP